MRLRSALLRKDRKEREGYTLKLTVSDIPVVGRFKVLEVPTKEILYQYDGEGSSELCFDIAFLPVLAIYEKDGYTVLETTKA